MRVLPSDISTRLNKPVQTKATNADPQLSFIISRKTTQLTDAEFMEQSEVVETNATDCSIAIKHSRFGRDSDAAYVAYVQNGMAKVASSPIYASIQRFDWIDAGFSNSAEAVAIAFDGTMPKDVRGKYEFITEAVPWVFWVSGGAVNGQKLGDTTINLATANVTDIAAVRAMWSDVPGFDFGLVLFLVINGAIYYRQLIDGVWSDAEPIPVAALPEGKTWTQISAQRTWDYRVALQAVDSIGDFYEVFTQFGGLGSKGAEHIEVRDVSATGKLTAIHYSTAAEEEHIEITSVAAGAPYGGLYSMAVPKIISARNLDDGTGNWGKLATFTFDVHIKPVEVTAQASAFSIVDANSVAYNAATATLGADGKTVTLTFTDINNARGECKATYTAGTVTSMAGTALTTTSCNFTPTGLVHTAVPVPEVTEVTNV